MVRHQIQLEDISPSYQLEAEIVSVNDKIIYLTGLLKTNETLSFFRLFEPETAKNHIVATFLAILELLKRNIILLEQDTSFEDIKITRIQGESNG
jgi:segregation and condensation protein A